MRVRCIAASIAAVGFAFPLAAAAQSPPTASPPGWTFSLTPYLWLPTIKGEVRYNLPNQVVVSSDTSIGPGDYLPHLHFALPFAAEANYQAFSILTDFMYLNLGGTRSRLGSVDFSAVPSNPVSSVRSVSADTSLHNVIWTLAGGYTVLQESWGMVQVTGGFRLYSVSATTDYNIAGQFTGPRGMSGPVFGGTGHLSASEDIWNGVAGVRGRIALGDSRFFLPYTLDVGAGDSKLTWQAQAGVGYQAGWGDVTAGYRYLSFEQYGSALVRKLSLGGALLNATFHF